VKYYIFGLQNTHTKLARQYIDVNFFAKNGNVNDFGHWSWNHNGDSEQATAHLFQNTPLIFTYKSPHKWMNSIIENDEEFINKYSLTQFPDYHDPRLLVKTKNEFWSLPRAIELWCEFHINWIRYLHRSNYVIMNQDKMSDQPYIIDFLSKVNLKLELEKKMPNWTLIKNDNVTEKNFLTDLQHKYISKKVPNEIIDFFGN
jgi:hypothetical protein